MLARFSGPTSRFPGFFRMHFDYTPEVDTGAVAKLALQVTSQEQRARPTAKPALRFRDPSCVCRHVRAQVAELGQRQAA